MRFTPLLVFLAACSPSEEQLAKQREDQIRQQQFVLEHTCIRKHGSPMMTNGEFKDCKYPWSVHIDKKQ